MPLILPRYLAPRRDERLASASQLEPARVPVAGTLRSRGVNVFRCPVCDKAFRQADEYEPLCTGPGATDDHEPTVMVFEP